MNLFHVFISHNSTPSLLIPHNSMCYSTLHEVKHYSTDSILIPRTHLFIPPKYPSYSTSYSTLPYSLFHAPIVFIPRSLSFIPLIQVLFHKGWNYVELTSIPHNSTGCQSPRWQGDQLSRREYRLRWARVRRQQALHVLHWYWSPWPLLINTGAGLNVRAVVPREGSAEAAGAS